MTDEKYLKQIEWEILLDPVEIEKISPSANLLTSSDKIGKIEVWRDQSYKIKARIKYIKQPRDNFKFSEQEAGRKAPTFTIKGKCYHGMQECKLDNCLIGSRKWSIDDTEKEIQMTLEANLITNQLKVNNSSIDSKFSWLTEWYLNGPQNQLLFHRRTEREFLQKFKRFRNTIGNVTTEFKGEGGGSNRNDFALIETNTIKFIVALVPDKIGPKWSKKIGIEYRENSGNIPELEQRKAIAEIVSFIMGRQLISVGYTKYSESGIPLEGTALSPWQDNTVSICKRPDSPPIEFYNPFSASNEKKFEEVLTRIVPTYLSLRNKLHLKEALWYYWFAENMTITGLSLPVFSTGLEILMKAWFQTKESKTKGVYMPKEEFEQFLIKEFQEISLKLKEKEFGEKIENRIHNSFNMGVSERFQFFFDEIGLKIGSLEKEAIKTRNLLAHGHIYTTENEWEKIYKMTQVYKTLFCRTMLKLLMYEENYIDRSTIGFPMRKIDEPAGGD